ncbi:MAG: metallophosphoesterase, partial [Sphingomicrobium sp.]
RAAKGYRRLGDTVSREDEGDCNQVRKALRWAGLLVVTAAALLIYAFFEARHDPVLRTTTISLVGLPPGNPPLKVALISDTHLASPDNSVERLNRLVDQVNSGRPDIVLLAGDYIGEGKHFSDWPSRKEAVAPFARLKPKLGVVAVLGNHDHWADAREVAQALSAVGATVLINQAVRLGPITIGGIDDDFVGKADAGATIRQARELGGPLLLLTHSPDIFPELPAGSVLLAGHTHCGQVTVPFVGAPYVPSRFGNRYRCGRYDESGKTLIVSSGIGTSVIPLRFGAMPDWWLLTLVPPRGPTI